MEPYVRGTWEIRLGRALPGLPSPLQLLSTRRYSGVLSDDELAAVWRASYGLGEYGTICRLLSPKSLASQTWNLPRERAKNGCAHQIPLSEQALDVLAGLAPSFGELRGPVFAPIGFSQAKKHLDELLPGTPAFGARPRPAWRALACGLRRSRRY
jgi:hypothetical protein